MRRAYKNILVIVLAIIVPGLLTAEDCIPASTGGNAQSQQDAVDKANKHVAYVPKNDIEFNNYNTRMKISDDPTTILWCTSAFPIPSSPLFTVPILGKLTSGTKRPFSTSQVQTNSSGALTYSPEIPGPDGMYGASSDYRYGFTPGGVYVEFDASMQTFCTTEPSVWQRQETKITLGTDAKLLAAQNEARTILARHNPPTAADRAQAERILEAAISGK